MGVKSGGGEAGFVRCGEEAPCTVADDLRARVRGLEAGLLKIEGHLLYSPPRTCPVCIAGQDCGGIPPCQAREGHHQAALDTTRTLRLAASSGGLTPADEGDGGTCKCACADIPGTVCVHKAPSPRDAVVEAADEYVTLWTLVNETDIDDVDERVNARVRLGYVRGHLFATVRALRAAEGRE